jgi:hypothetical protein
MSNLLEKASIVLTPTAYSDGTLHSIKPLQTLGSELVTNGTFDTDSDWTKGTGWTISGGTASFDGSESGSANFSQSNVISDQSKTYRVEFTLSNYAAGNVKSKFGNNAQGESRTANGTYVDILSGMTNNALTFTPSADFVGSIDNVSVKEVIDADFDFTRSTTATRENSSGNIESVAAGLPRIDYLGGTGNILLETQSTNTATYSNDFTQGDIFVQSADPALSNSVLSTNQSTAPDGTTTANKLTDSNDSGTGSITLNYNSTTFTSGEASTVSMFVKKDTVRYFRIAVSNLDTTQATSFDLDTGLVNDGTGVMTDYGDGWYRCSATITTTTDLVGQVQFAISENFDRVGNNLRNGTKSTFLWGLQAEEQSFPTSYIPTSGSTVSRSADAAINSGSSDLINSTEGVLYIEAKTDNSSVGSISINDGTSSTRITARFRPDISKIQMAVLGATSDFTFNSATITLSEYNKIAIVYNSSGQYYFFINGVKSAVQSEGTFNSNSFTQLDFNRGGGNEVFYGKVKSVAVFKEALTDAQLTALTS